MKSKSLFSLGLLIVAGIVSMMGTPTDVQAALTINSVRIYVNPNLVAPENDNTPTTPIDFTVGRPGPVVESLGGRLAAIDNFAAGTLQGGTLIDASNAHSVGANAITANAGDIIAIAFGMRESGTSLQLTSSINLAFDTIGTPSSETGVGGMTYENVLAPSRHIEGSSSDTPFTVTAGTDFTVVYLYQVKPGDIDADGEWITRRAGTSTRTNDGPFIRYGMTPVVEIPADITVYYPKIDGSVSTIPSVQSIEITPEAPHTGKSLWHTVRRRVPADGDYTLESDENAGKEVRYYNQGDTISFHLKFSEPMRANPDTKLYLSFDGWPVAGTRFDNLVENSLYASLRRGSGDGGSDTLIFDYKVQPHDDVFDLGIVMNGPGLSHNSPGAITDKTNFPFDTVRTHINVFLNRYYGGALPIVKGGPANYATPAYKGTNFLIDTLPANVRITGVITPETHDAQGRRTAHVNFEDVAGSQQTSGEGIAPDSAVQEETEQTTDFDIEIRFFNYGVGDGDGVLADDPQGFEPADISITGTGVNRGDWDVTLALIGLDHRDPGYYGDSLSDGSLGKAKPAAAFMVYKATITPALGFRGDVAISVPAGATQDIAGNASYASNTLTVPVNNPLRVVETPAIVVPPAGAYTAGDKIEIEVTYAKDNLRYEGDNPPYLTLYLGEEVPANARHATWQTAEDINSTKVTFAYTVAATDTLAEAVRVPSVKMLVPEGTMLLSGPLTAPAEQQSGTEAAAAESGAAPKTVPVVEPLPSEDTSGREVSPVVSDTPVVPYTPFVEEAAPKAAASDVPRDPIVFNELGNGSGDADDWLELRNVTGSAVSLKDWELSIVQDGKKEDTSLIAFVEDVSVPANGLLLITNSNPTAEGNVLAGGDNVATAAVETKGSPHLYLVNAGLSLPDDGKFLLILRNTKEKLGMNAAFVDVAGGGGSDTDAFVREQTGDYDTHVWPLQVLQAPGGETEDALGSGKVWQRAKADIVGYHKDAWAEAAFTGIGYDRQVSESAATSGTPGYPNGAAKETAATPKGSITLSEIMFDSGGGTLPQWIELYNASKTEVLNLNRWKLEIQNADSEDLDGRPIVTLTLQEKLIQPNQTLLIVAGDARASSAMVLPADRLYNLFDLHEKNLRIKTPRDTFLSAEGFYLKLTDRNENLVDEVGNKDSDRRSDDAPAWALPLSSEEGSRSSLIRRYDNGVALPGQKRASWILAARLKPFDERLHYGHAEDIGTPGHREGGALPVELSSFSMTRNETGAVVLTWTTESEVDNAGFNLRRSLKRASGFTLLNPALIAGAGTTGERQTYTFTDTSAKPGIEYYYQIEEVAFDGKPATLATRLLRGPVSASNRMLTTFGEVKRQK